MTPYPDAQPSSVPQPTRVVRLMKELPMLHVYEANPGTPPCLILAHADPGYQAAIGRGFRRLGWEHLSPHSGPEARRLVPCWRPTW